MSELVPVSIAAVASPARQRGQATPLLAAVLVVAAVVAIAIAHLGGIAVDSARASTAADAAALAGVADGRAAAADVARANHGRLISFLAADTDVIVVVQVGRVRATARARVGYPPW